MHGISDVKRDRRGLPSLIKPKGKWCTVQIHKLFLKRLLLNDTIKCTASVTEEQISMENGYNCAVEGSSRWYKKQIRIIASLLNTNCTLSGRGLNPELSGYEPASNHLTLGIALPHNVLEGAERLFSLHRRFNVAESIIIAPWTGQRANS
jgi:hypothetical protein